MNNEKTEEKIVVTCGNEPVNSVDVLVLFPNNTWKRGSTDETGIVELSLYTNKEKMKIFVAKEGYAACFESGWVPDKSDLKTIQIEQLTNGGSYIFPYGIGVIPGIDGSLDVAYRDTNSYSLYANNVAVNGGVNQPVLLELNDLVDLKDCDGNEFSFRVVKILDRAVLVEYLEGSVKSNVPF